MAILKVAQLGHPVLRAKAKKVTREEILSDAFQAFLDDMVDTMHEYDGVGLAAPQVHVSKQVAVIEVEGNPRYPNQGSVPLTFLINPKIRALSKKVHADWEGCLSVEGYRGRVPRLLELELEALDREANPYRVQAKGFFARVIQHEFDHLQGNVYLDRMPDLQTLTNMQDFMRYWVSADEEA